MTDIPAHILALAERLRTQDNRCTAHPIFCVQRQYRIEGLEDSDEWEWRDSDWHRADKEKAEELDNAPPEVSDIDGWTRIYYQSRWHTVMVALTKEGAERYLRNNAHNLSEYAPPRIYVESLYKCEEMIQLREWLMTLGVEQAIPRRKGFAETLDAINTPGTAEHTYVNRPE
jgi:hypothetical protein